jgi:ferredoxin
MSYKKGEPLTDTELMQQMPSRERLQRGPVAIIECIEEIPCNPCVESCPQGAISMPGGLNQIPRLDWDKCTGCGLCISSCPGLAIFMVDLTRSEGTAAVSFPYEFRPLPHKGEKVLALDRSGRELGAAEVLRVQTSKRLDRTPVITIAVPGEWALKARHIRPMAVPAGKG